MYAHIINYCSTAIIPCVLGLFLDIYFQATQWISAITDFIELQMFIKQDRAGYIVFSYAHAQTYYLLYVTYAHFMHGRYQLLHAELQQ